MLEKTTNCIKVAKQTTVFTKDNCFHCLSFFGFVVVVERKFCCFVFYYDFQASDFNVSINRKNGWNVLFKVIPVDSRLRIDLDRVDPFKYQTANVLRLTVVKGENKFRMKVLKQHMNDQLILAISISADAVDS